MAEFECRTKFDIHPTIMHSLFRHSGFQIDGDLMGNVHRIIEYTALIKHMCDNYGYKVSEAAHKLYISTDEAQKYYDGYVFNTRTVLRNEEVELLECMRNTGGKLTFGGRELDNWISAKQLYVYLGHGCDESSFNNTLTRVYNYICTLRDIDFKYNIYADNVTRGYQVAEVNYERITFNPEGCYKEYCKNNLNNRKSSGDNGTILNKRIEQIGIENKNFKEREDKLEEQKRLKFNYNMVMAYLSELDEKLARVAVTETDDCYTVYAAFTSRRKQCIKCSSSNIKCETQSIKMLDLPYMGKLVYVVITNNTIYTCDKCGNIENTCGFASEYKNGLFVTNRMKDKLSRQASLNDKRFLNNIGWSGEPKKVNKVSDMAWFVGWVKSVYGDINILGYQSYLYDKYDIFISSIGNTYNNMICSKCGNVYNVVEAKEVDVTPASFDGKIRVLYERLLIKCDKCGSNTFEPHTMRTDSLREIANQRQEYEKAVEYDLLGKLRGTLKSINDVIIQGHPRDDSVKQAIMSSINMSEYRDVLRGIRNTHNSCKETLEDLDSLYKEADRLETEIDSKFESWICMYGGGSLNTRIENVANKYINQEKAQREHDRIESLKSFLSKMKCNMYNFEYMPLSNKWEYGKGFWAEDRSINGYVDEHVDNIMDYIKIQTLFYDGFSLSDVAYKMGMTEKCVSKIMSLGYNPFRLARDNEYTEQELSIIKDVDSGSTLDEAYNNALINGYKHTRDKFDSMLKAERANRHTIIRAIWLVCNEITIFTRLFKDYDAGVDNFYLELDHYLYDRP